MMLISGNILTGIVMVWSANIGLLSLFDIKDRLLKRYMVSQQEGPLFVGRFLLLRSMVLRGSSSWKILQKMNDLMAGGTPMTKRKPPLVGAWIVYPIYIYIHISELEPQLYIYIYKWNGLPTSNDWDDSPSTNIPGGFWALVLSSSHASHRWDLTISQPVIAIFWLVVYLPLWKIWVRQLGLWISQEYK